MNADTCPPTPPSVFGTMSPKSPARSSTTSPMDSKSNILMTADRASPDPNCAICLGKLENKSFTNSCLHQFCFNCLLEWSKVKAVCPLCKQGFQSIIHNVRSIEDYDQYHLLPNETPYHWSFEVPAFRYRTTMVGDVPRMRMAASLVLQPMPNHRRPQQLPWTRSRRQTATIEFRRSVYSRGLCAMRLPDVTGRYRDTSPEFYRTNPAQLHRLVPWLNRELSVIIDNEMYIAVVLDQILSMIQHHPITSPQMRNLLIPHAGPRRTDIFIHEFSCFASSPYDMIGFDESVQYSSFVPESIDIASSDSSTEDDDSDVIILSSVDGDVEEEDSGNRLRRVDHPTSSVSPVAGPSGEARCILQMVAEGLGFNNMSDTDSTNSEAIPIQAGSRTASQFNVDSSDSDDCEIIGYVKPLHERTPEIITLDSDEEAVEETRREHSNHANSATSNEDLTDYASFINSSYGGQRPYSPSMPEANGLNIAACSSAHSSVDIKPRDVKTRSRKSRNKKRSTRGRRRVDSSSSCSPVVRKKRSRKLSSTSSESSASSIVFRKKCHQKPSSDSSSSCNRRKYRRSVSLSSSASSEHVPRSFLLQRQIDNMWKISDRSRSSQEDYSHSLASRMSYSPPYSTEEIDSLNRGQQRPKLRSIVITRASNDTKNRNVSCSSLHSSKQASHHSSSSRYSHRSKHKSRGKEREKKHKRKYKKRTHSSSSEEFRIRDVKRRIHSITYSDSDSN